MTGSKILILGSRGTVGSAIVEAAGHRALKAARFPVANDTLMFDAWMDDSSQLLEGLGLIPSAVVIAFGISGTHTCASDPVRSRRLNVDRVVAVAAAIARCGSLPVLLSTDSVFDGAETFWTEQDVPSPSCEYGRQKLDAERALAALGVPYLIVRLSRVIADHACQRDIVYQWCHQIRLDEEIVLPTDQTFTPIAAQDLGRIIVLLIDAKGRGLVHVAGPQKSSPGQLVDMISAAGDELGIRLKLKRKLCRVADLPGLEPRPVNTLLSIKRLQEMIAPQFTPISQSVRDVVAAAFADHKPQYA